LNSNDGDIGHPRRDDLPQTGPAGEQFNVVRPFPRARTRASRTSRSTPSPLLLSTALLALRRAIRSTGLYWPVFIESCD